MNMIAPASLNDVNLPKNQHENHELGLSKLFDNMLGKTFINLVVPWDGLFFACFGVPVEVMTPAMPYQFTTEGGDFLDKLCSFHRVRVNSFTS